MEPLTNRVQIAAHHWQPRFVANGIDVNDFENVLARTVEWSDWGPNWHAMGGVHEAIGLEAERGGRMVSAAAALQKMGRPNGTFIGTAMENALMLQLARTTLRRCITSVR